MFIRYSFSQFYIYSMKRQMSFVFNSLKKSILCPTNNTELEQFSIFFYQM